MKKFYLFLLTVLLGSALQAQIPSALATQLQNVLNDGINNKGMHGNSAHLILQSGQTWTGTAGVNGQGQPILDTTVFIAASISKLNIALVLLLMQEDGILDLDDTWHDWLPNLNVAFDTNITIRQLLNHTSGIKDYLEVPSAETYITNNFSYFYTPQYVLENIISGTPDFAAGTNFSYSNSNYCLAAYIAEAATANSLKDELHNRIWDPLGMNHTYFGAYEPINDPSAGRWWHFAGGSAGVADYSNQSDTSILSFGYGTDNVVTCPTDLAKLVHALTNNQILNAQSMTELQTWVPQSAIDWTGNYGLGIHHLLGQTVDSVIGHNGKFMNESDVFHSSMCGFTLCCMSNTYGNWEWLYNQMYSVIRNYYACNAVPVANFYATPKTACTGNIVTLRDSSTNYKPTAWNWNIPGATFVNGTNANDSMPQVIYNTSGFYPISYTATAIGGSNSITKNNYITINNLLPAHNSSFLESFESTIVLPSADWTIYNRDTLNWALTSTAAATGTNSIYIDNFSNTAGNKSHIYSEAIDISGFASPKLSFKMAYRQAQSSNFEKLQVTTSTDCGNTWIARWTRQGSTLATVSPANPAVFIPTAAQFTTYTVNIIGVAGSNNLRIKFEFTADALSPGNNIYIDDINIYDATVGVESKFSNDQINVFPNPSTESVNILSGKELDDLTIEDVLGRTVFQSDKKDKRYQVNLQTEGVYILKANISNQIIVKKIIIKQ